MPELPDLETIRKGLAPRLTGQAITCPAARFVPAREEAYRAAHGALAAAASRFTPTVETAGLGLLYAEVSGLARSFGFAQDRRFGPDPQLAHQMAREAEQACGLDVRVGVGSGKFVAEQAARAPGPKRHQQARVCLPY